MSLDLKEKRSLCIISAQIHSILEALKPSCASPMFYTHTEPLKVLGTEVLYQAVNEITSDKYVQHS